LGKNRDNKRMYRRNCLRETYGSPIFGLGYSDENLNYALIGWAMNNMFGQVTWSLTDFQEREKINPYTGWEKNMNKITAIPYTDIAIVFSRMTRDWSKNEIDYPKEGMGLRQFLSERHIPHTFILDDAISNLDLSLFNMLLAPRMDCISDSQEQLLKQLVSNGGTLFLTCRNGPFIECFRSESERWR